MRLPNRSFALPLLAGALSVTLVACATSEAQSLSSSSSGSVGSVDAGDPAPTPTGDAEMTVTLLGTGSPVPSAERFGMSTLVRAGGQDLLFDAGRGATIRLNQVGLSAGQVDGVFLTHFHSDHVNGLADLWMSSYIPALGGREGSFQLYGPTGVGQIAEGLQLTHQNDIDVRVADGEVDPSTTGIEPHEFDDDGVIFEKDGVTVTMFTVEHDPVGAIDPAVGFRVDNGESSVLISGDTRPTPNVLTYGEGVDLLIHEVADFVDPTLPVVETVYAHHTNPRQAGEIFTSVAPAMAAYSHIVNGAPPRIPDLPMETLVERTRETYSGPLAVGVDLMTFEINDRDVQVFEPRG
ncbi:ribonuclease Z [Dietzia sp. NCCP-2495]|uniref:MBL fold metallo-hydrolase n=1 Tax=Dietzia sp. NCCP-2495 TaxID=2934675 RepID=UPI00222F0F31|nr:MBL fold metallo-hydrolase [Dietzia sp. NCCP-2495]GLB63841.1 ribonuclease Z [Dietzia sp. NCCP-2495]